jgi:hypothetical protein
VVLELLDPDDETAVTTRFSRHSLPYERIDIEPLREPLGASRSRSRRFVQTVKLRPLHTPWFETDHEALDATVDPVEVERRQSWWWLAISLGLGALAVAAMLMLTRP